MMFMSVSMGLPFSQVAAMSAAEISLYQAYYRISPWGEERADLRNAMQMQQTAEMHRDRRKHAEPYKLADFMPFWKKRELSPDELREKLRSAFAGRKK